MERRYAAISLNFDSLNHAYGFPVGYRDPSFFEVADRFLSLADQLDFRYSISVIGRDLEVPAYRERVRAWVASGHEIGNHSWSHPMNLGALSAPDIHAEVARAHVAITASTGHAPRGFTAPVWSSSPELLRVLIDLGYTYDASAFPSWVLLPATVKNMWNYRRSPVRPSLFARRDLAAVVAGPRQTYVSTGGLSPAPVANVPGIAVLPIPTNRLRVACWHTLGFSIGWTLHERLLRSCLRTIDAFYYLVHPADLMDARDGDSARALPLERMRVPLAEKWKALERMIRTIRASGRAFVTMEELAVRTVTMRMLAARGQ